MTVATLESLKDLVSQMKPIVDGDISEADGIVGVDVGQDQWSYRKCPYCHDFNKEIFKPGISEIYPRGALVIRCDDNFYIEAILPLVYKELPLPEIVKVLWPDITDAEFKADYYAELDDAGA